MNWVDYAIIGFILLNVIIGMWKGFLLSVSNMVCMITSIIIAKSYYKIFAQFLIDNTKLADKITGFVSHNNFLTHKNPIQAMIIGLPQEANINTFLVMAIINAIAILSIYLFIRFLLYFVEKLFKDVVKLPGLKELNGIGGGTIGLVKALLILLIIFAACIPISGMLPWAAFNQAVQASTLAQCFYKYNFILGWVWNAAVDLIK